MIFDETAFNKLRADRLAYVDGLRRNKGFEAGILKLLTQLYPDNAHFIYELLQNAEDAKATHAKFSLSLNSLIFEHDGSRLFSARDVESITSIGDSTKADSPTEIGKFGVGFKAVFAYTQTPEIYSGHYHFRISDLVVPELLTKVKIDACEFNTRFEFPFNHASKTSQIATAEISRALEELSETTLLFLSNIKRISYILSDNSNGSLVRNSEKDRLLDESQGEIIQVKVSRGAADSSNTSWLRYMKSVSVVDENKKKEFSVAIAFSLHQKDSKNKNFNWEIVPLNPGRVSIFFPAEKELSNLRFHLHAPFASTVARDSVRDTEGNKLLLDGISELCVESMMDIRSRGLLNVSFLNVLPIQDDSIPQFYRPVMERIVDAFKNKALVPTRYSEHRAGCELLRGPSDLINLIDDNELGILTNGERINVAWAASVPITNQRANKFLDAIDIQEWSWREFIFSLGCEPYRIRSKNDLKRPERLKIWLSNKEDLWLRKLYAVLNDATEKQSSNVKFTDLPCIRVEKDGLCSMVRPSEAFIPQNLENSLQEDISWVKPSTYTSEKSGSQSASAKIFLEKIGVRVFDEAAALQLLVETYKQESYPNSKLHLVHMKRFIQFFKSCPDRSDIFKDKLIFISEAINQLGEIKLEWNLPSKLYLDSPFLDTGLYGTYASKEKKSLWHGYEKIADKKAFLEFAKALGIQSELRIIKASAWENPNKDTLCKDWFLGGVRESVKSTNEDWTIKNISNFTSSQKIEDSRIIWNTLIKANGSYAQARYRPNLQFSIREADSQLVEHLRNNAWIPDADGNFHLPRDIGRHQLPPGFPYDDRNGLLTAIGFEASIQIQTKEYERKDIAAKDFGFEGVGAAKDMANALKITGIDSKQAAKLIMQNCTKPELPTQEVIDPLRRRRGLDEHRENAPSKESVLLERAIQPNVKGIVAEAKAYLRVKYTNSIGQLVCQLCRNEMPFKLGTGEYYFEAVQAIREISHHYYENRLALCPTCAAMYQYAKIISDSELTQKILSTDIDTIGSALELDLLIAGSIRNLHFVGVHFFDFRVLLEKSDFTKK